MIVSIILAIFGLNQMNSKITMIDYYKKIIILNYLINIKSKDKSNDIHNKVHKQKHVRNKETSKIAMDMITDEKDTKNNNQTNIKNNSMLNVNNAKKLNVNSAKKSNFKNKNKNNTVTFNKDYLGEKNNNNNISNKFMNKNVYMSIQGKNSEVPILISSFNTNFVLKNNILIDDGFLEINDLKKNIFLTKGTLINLSNCEKKAQLFLEGYIKSKVNYMKFEKHNGDNIFGEDKGIINIKNFKHNVKINYLKKAKLRQGEVRDVKLNFNEKDFKFNKDYFYIQVNLCNIKSNNNPEKIYKNLNNQKIYKEIEQNVLVELNLSLFKKNNIFM